MGTLVEEEEAMVVEVVVEVVEEATMEEEDAGGDEVEEGDIDKDQMNMVKDLKVKVNNAKRSRKGHLSTRDGRDATEADVVLLHVAMTQLEKKVEK